MILRGAESILGAGPAAGAGDRVVNLAQKFTPIDQPRHPRVAGELNGQHVRLVELQGEFTWHRHDREDESFLVVDGLLERRPRDRTAEVRPGEFIIVPRGVEHCPYVERDTQVLLFEHATAVNTGNLIEARTRGTVPAV